MIEFKKYPENKPEYGDVCLCECPEWRNVGYDVAIWTGKKFDDSEMNNDMFNDCVIGFCVIDS